MFTLNKRILRNELTGLQRYLSEILSRTEGQFIHVRPQRRLTGLLGQIWEQVVLPARSRKSILWSPCNTGPLMLSRQVVTIHDVAALDHPEWLNWKFALWYTFLLPRLVRRVRAVIAVSEFTKQRLIDTTSIASEKITVIPNGVDSRFRPQSEAAISRMAVALTLPSRRYVLAVGPLEPRKNIGRLLRAWREAQEAVAGDIWLVIAGDRDRTSMFPGYTGTEILPPRVHLAGHVDEALMPQLYAGALAFVDVSKYEGFGLPALEAMACGVPVLVSDDSAFPEVVGDAGLYAKAHNISDIREGLVRLLTEPALTATLIARGLERVKRFTWEQTAAQTLSLLRRVNHEA